MGTGQKGRWTWVAEWLLAIVVAMVASAIAVGPVMMVARLPAQTVVDGRRYEPPPVPGARVRVGDQLGTVTREVAYLWGPKWQVRLDNGRHVVVHRVEMVVLEWPDEMGGVRRDDG